MPIRLVVFEDKSTLRDGLQQLFADSGTFELTGMFSNALHADEDIVKLQPDVILMDIDMPGINGIEAVKRIRSKNLKVNIIMLTIFDEDEKVFNALQAGANGYLLKTTPPAKLLEAIVDVHNGGAPMTSSVARQVLQMFSQHKKNTKSDYNLTDRERDVLQLLVNGQSYKSIAGSLTISLDTVRSHIKGIYDKLHVNSKGEALSKAYKEKLI
jgi:DNA-binding NarL/FixJ family response regulator